MEVVGAHELDHTAVALDLGPEPLDLLRLGVGTQLGAAARESLDEFETVFKEGRATEYLPQAA